METKQKFTFTGLSWMYNGYDYGDTALNLTRCLNFMRQFGLDWQIIHNRDGVRLEITGYTDVLNNRMADDSVTFLFKYRYTEKSTDKLALDTDFAVDDDRLIIMTINEDMKPVVKQLFWDGETLEMINIVMISN